MPLPTIHFTPEQVKLFCAARSGGKSRVFEIFNSLCWNRETEVWEPVAEARWFECGHPLEAVNRLCTKFIGHGGSHGKRDA